MRKKEIIVLLIRLLVICPLILSTRVPSSLWWEIKVTLIADGEYKMEGGEKTYSGNYSFATLWTGTMERDNTDYILYHLDSEILRWEAQEKAVSADFFNLLTTSDFAEKPCFNLNYILRRGDVLHFDFSVQGFDVPRNESPDKFYLNLPCSEENNHKLREINYNSFVAKGSNRISFEEKEIYLAPQEKTFVWTWKSQKWMLKQERTVFLSNGHKVKAHISIKPHH